MTMDLYIDYLICSTSYTTATGLSELTDNAISHDKVTRFLSSKDYTAADLWKQGKSLYRSVEDEDAVLIIDDTIEKKPYTDENDLISWHFDHTESRSVKGVNLVTALYETQKGSLPVGYELIKKTEKTINEKTGKVQRKSPITKQEIYRQLIQSAINNNVKFKYALNDTWFSSSENMRFIVNAQKHFVMPLKSNRKVALSEADKLSNNFVRIDSIDSGEDILVRLEDVDFPLRFTRQVFKDGDGSAGVLYLVSDDIELTNEQMNAIYKRRWKVETYHESLKNNASLEKSPTKKERTQANHLFASLCAYMRLESLSMKIKFNHFALKGKIYMIALKKAMLELQRIRSSNNFQFDHHHCAPA